MNKPVSANSALVLIDVDYYVDINALASHKLPMVLWTFNPVTDFGSNDESSWRVDGQEYEFRVHGGRSYRHRVWEYGCSDYVQFRYGACKYNYSIERYRPPGSQHQLIMLQPACYGFNIPDEFVVGRRVMGDRQYFDGDSVVIVSGALHFKLRTTLYQTVVSKLASGAVAPHTLVQYFKEHKRDLLLGDESYVGEWFYRKAEKIKMTGSTGLTFASVVMREDGTFVPNAIKPTYVRMIEAPTNVEASAPTNDRSSDAAAVITRITNVSNTVVPDQIYSLYAEEFAGVLLDNVGIVPFSVAPLSENEVIDRVERTATRLKCQAVSSDPFLEVVPEMVVVEAFYKKELYVTPKDERNISPTQDEHLLALSRYTYRFKDSLKTTRWYMPGRTPKEIARNVTDLFSTSETCWETDFSRFDGTISEWIRVNVERKVYGKTFGYTSDVTKLISNEVFRAQARTRAGRYCTGGSRLSGSPLTTDGNTLINAYVQFCAYRTAGFDAAEAYRRIGLCYGDDGLMSGNGMDVHMSTVCTALGLTIKLVEAGTPSRPYAGFLGRIFPRPGGSVNSFQDPMRVWPKIHLTRKLGGSVQTANFVSKIASFALTDGLSPLLGDYCRKVLCLMPEAAHVRKILERRDTLMSTLSDSWLYLESAATIDESWPQTPSEPGDVLIYASLLRVTIDHLAVAEGRVASAKKIGGLSNLLMLDVERPDPRFVLDGDAFTEGQPLLLVTQRAQPALGRRTKSERKNGDTNSTRSTPTQASKGTSDAAGNRWVRKGLQRPAATSE